jgi:hypothetical protein
MVAKPSLSVANDKRTPVRPTRNRSRRPIRQYLCHATSDRALLKLRGVSANRNHCNKATRSFPTFTSPDPDGRSDRRRCNMGSKFRFLLAVLPTVLSFTTIALASLVLLFCLASEVPLVFFVSLAVLVFRLAIAVCRVMASPTPRAGGVPTRPSAGRRRTEVLPSREAHACPSDCAAGTSPTAPALNIA